MRSTGEVMGIDRDFGTAFAKSQLAAVGGLPTTGRVFVSMANRDKRAMVFPVMRLRDLGFTLVATTGTAGLGRRAPTLGLGHDTGDGGRHHRDRGCVAPQRYPG